MIPFEGRAGIHAFAERTPILLLPDQERDRDARLQNQGSCPPLSDVKSPRQRCTSLRIATQLTPQTAADTSWHNMPSFSQA